MRGRLARRAREHTSSACHRVVAPIHRERAQANAAAAAFGVLGTIIAAALLWMLLNEAAQPMFDVAFDLNNSSQAENGTADAQLAWNHALFFTLVLALIMGWATAAASARGP